MKTIIIKMKKDGSAGQHDNIANSPEYWCFRFKRYLIPDVISVMQKCKETRQGRNKPKPILMEIEWMDEDIRDTWEVENLRKPTFTYRTKLACSVKCPYVQKNSRESKGNYQH